LDDFKTLILCADDFGLSAGVSAGILHLVRKQRLSAVSCMLNAPDFTTSAHELSTFKNNVQIGLHFNLTEGSFFSDSNITCFGLNELLIKTHLGLISSSLIRAEFNAQLDGFIDVMGCLPDFIDGHQHVHQFPGIRSVLFEVYEKRLRAEGTSIRSTYPAISLPPYQLKAQILSLTGGKKLQQQLNKRQINHNDYFSGIYDFAPGTNYRELFRQWLAGAKSNTLLMCHPGEGIDLEDPIRHTRNKELAYLLSDEFIHDCEEFGVSLATGPVTR